MTHQGPSIRERVDKVTERVDIVALIGKSVKLTGKRQPRGKCPFHDSSSDSFAVNPEPRGGGAPYAHCFGCGWHGDVVKFVVEFFGQSFMDALRRLEEQNGLADLAAAPVHREKEPQSRRVQRNVDSATMGLYIWDAGKPDLEAIRTYFVARGVPAAMLGPDRLRDFRFCKVAPVCTWEEGRKPTSVPTAPALIALIRRPIPPVGVEGGRPWRPIGAHITFLRPDLTGKMDRRWQSGEAMPARKMCGDAAGGCVVLGRYRTDVPLFVGEGNETVLSGMAIAEAADHACGLAALSLDNLQGHQMLTRSGARPLYDIQPDSGRAPALAFLHDGPVTVLVDADMKPLRGMRDRDTGEYTGVPVIARRGAPVTMRALTAADRARICSVLTVKAWQAAGTRRVEAVRPPMGMDFNDVGRIEA